MCSYSTINGTYACQNPYLLNTVLRQQFGFTGFVTSDWGATHSTAASANAGLDQDMPGNDGYYGSALQRGGVRRPGQPGHDEHAVSQILTEMFGFGLFDKAPSGSPGRPRPAPRTRPTRPRWPRRAPCCSRTAATSCRWLRRQVDRGDRRRRLDQSADRGRRQRRGQLQRHRHPAAGHHRRRAERTTVNYNDGSSDSSAASAAAAASVAVVFVSNDESEGSDLTSIDLSSAQNA